MSNLRIPALACLLLLHAPSLLGSTVRWTSVEVTPSHVVLRCKYHDTLTDTQTRDSLARRYGLVGQIEAVTHRIGAMRSAGYSVSGPRGAERLAAEVPFDGVFEQQIAFTARATHHELRLYGRLRQGRGKIIANSRIKPHLTDANRRLIDTRYRGWEGQFRAGMEQIEQKLSGYRFILNDSERPDLSRAMRGSVAKIIRDFGICDSRHDVRVRANWERSVDRGLGQ